MRTRQTYMAKCLLAFLCFLSFSIMAQPSISDLEYFLDSDPGFGNGTQVSITAGTDIDESFSINLSGTSLGFHKLFFRAKDSNGSWSLTDMRDIFKLAPSASFPPIPNVIAAEYFFDTDPGFGNGTALTVTSGQNVDENYIIDITGLSLGFHAIFFRVQDGDGIWSMTDKRNIFKLPQPIAQPPIPDVIAAEYFFDTDPGFGNGTALTVTSGQNLDENYIIDITGLSLGFHTIFFRVQDGDGIWSMTDKRDIFKLPQPIAQPPIPNVIVAENFFDTDPGFGNGTALTVTSGQNVDENYIIDITGLSLGFHTIFFRVQDGDGVWSMTDKRDIFKLPQPVAQPPIPNVTAAEYFFDTDPGFGNGTALAVTSGQNVDENYIIDITSLSLGFHTIFFRVQDADGVWSMTDKRDIFKLPQPVAQPPIPDVMAMEYFIDTDPGFENANSVPVTTGQNINENFFVDLTGLSIGIHYLSFRVKDSDGKWSLTTMYEITKNNPTITSWTGNVSTEWNNTGNWDNGIPDLSITAVIPDVSGTSGNFPDIVPGENVECFDLTINNGSNINDQGALTINGVLTNLAGTNGLTIESDATATGSLIHNTQGVSANMQQYLSSERWHFVSSPIGNAEIGVYTNIYLKQWNEPTADWTYLVQPTTLPMNTGQGYSAWSSNGLLGNTTVNYNGNLNIDDVTLNLPYTTASPQTGWYLAGNPFSSAIDWNTNWNFNNVGGWAIVYDNGVSRGWNPYLPPGSQSYNGKTDGIIPATQGFWLRATGNAAQITIPASERVHSSQSFYKATEAEIEMIRLTAEGNGYADEAIIIFHPEGTPGFDGLYDLEKHYNVTEAPQFYSIISESEFYSVNVLPADELMEGSTVELGFEVGVPGEYSISASELNSIDPSVSIFLEDLKLQLTTDLRIHDTYTFTSDPLDIPKRFVLHFGVPNSVGDNTADSKIAIWSFGQDVYVKTPEKTTGHVEVYDMMGIKVYSGRMENTNQFKFTLHKNIGYYVVKVITETNTVSQKVFIQ